MTKKKEVYVSTSKMEPALKRKWVKVLRSRKFKQVSGCLEERGMDGKYIGNCCLGVLCRITDTPSKNPKEYHSEVRFGKGGNTGTLDKPLLRKFGLSSEDQDQLIAMNDGDITDTNENGRRYGFKAIATFIEKNIKAKKKLDKAS